MPQPPKPDIPPIGPGSRGFLRRTRIQAPSRRHPGFARLVCGWSVLSLAVVRSLRRIGIARRRVELDFQLLCEFSAGSDGLA